MAGLPPPTSTPVSLPFPGPPSLLLLEGGCSEQTPQRRLAVGGWPSRSISCLWFTTASCPELQHLTPLNSFLPGEVGGREGLTGFAGPETQAPQQRKEARSQVSRHPASPSPSEDLESSPHSKTPLRQILEFRGTQLCPLPWDDLPFGPLSSGWELTSLRRLQGTFSSQAEVGDF